MRCVCELQLLHKMQSGAVRQSSRLKDPKPALPDPSDSIHSPKKQQGKRQKRASTQKAQGPSPACRCQTPEALFIQNTWQVYYLASPSAQLNVAEDAAADLHDLIMMMLMSSTGLGSLAATRSSRYQQPYSCISYSSVLSVWMKLNCTTVKIPD